MRRETELDALESAVSRLADSIAGLSDDGSGRQDALKDVFRINQEIGRIARSLDWMAPALRDMQLEVNLTTIQIKNGRSGSAREAFAKVSSSFAKVMATQASGRPGREPAFRRNL